MTFSLNTNGTAQIALQNLNATNRDLAITQNRISTGLNVAGAKDDGAVYSIAQGMRADIESIDAASNSLARARGLADVAIAAGEAISDLLNEMRQFALAGSDSSINSTSRAAYNADYVSLLEQVSTLIESADFAGTNLLNGSKNAEGLNVEALATYEVGQQLTVAVTDFDALIFETNFGSTPDSVAIRIGQSVNVGSSGSDLSGISTDFDAAAGSLTYGLGGETLANARTNGVRTGFTGFYSSNPNGSEADVNAASAARAAAMAEAVSLVSDRLNNELARLGTVRKKLELQETFLQKLQDSYISGVGNLVDANLAQESARLQALQIKQQLGGQALGIANRSPEIIISLYQ